MSIPPELRSPGRPAGSPNDYNSGNGPAKMNWWYESVSDWLIQCPEKTLKDCAVQFNVTPQWIYTLIHSRAFKEYHDARRVQHNALVSLGIIEKVEAVADIALDHLIDKMADQGSVLPVKSLTEVADTMLSRLGYGGSRGGGPVAGPTPVNLTVNNVILTQARAAHSQRLAMLGVPARPPDLAQLVEPENNTEVLTLEPEDVTTPADAA